jgi:hypothetical protein
MALVAVAKTKPTPKISLPTVYFASRPELLISDRERLVSEVSKPTRTCSVTTACMGAYLARSRMHRTLQEEGGCCAIDCRRRTQSVGFCADRWRRRDHSLWRKRKDDHSRDDGDLQRLMHDELPRTDGKGSTRSGPPRRSQGCRCCGVSPGSFSEPILFDDGKSRGVIRDVAEDRLRVEITGVTGGTAKLKAEKGINLPESDLALPALTPKDIEDLALGRQPPARLREHTGPSRGNASCKG